ncbi:MAG: hypothetical protein AAGC65_06450 [Mucilaginibacter sp.]
MPHGCIQLAIAQVKPIGAIAALLSVITSSGVLAEKFKLLTMKMVEVIF